MREFLSFCCYLLQRLTSQEPDSYYKSVCILQLATVLNSFTINSAGNVNVAKERNSISTLPVSQWRSSIFGRLRQVPSSCSTAFSPRLTS